MDPNSEDRGPSVEVAEVNIEAETTPNPVHPPPLEPLLASSIFRQAFQDGLPTEGDRPAPGSGAGLGGATSSPEPSSVDPEKVQQWQEEEFQRRLRGGYEAAQQRLGQVVSSNMDRPLRLNAIRLSPAPATTRPSFLNSLLTPFLTQSNPLFYPTPAPPRTLHEILLTSRSVVGYLDRFGVWDMERSGLRLEHTPGGDEDQVDLVLALKERGRLFLKAGTEVGGGEGGGNVTARIRNALGGGEAIEANASIGTKTKSAYQLSFTTPLFASPLLSFALSGFSLDRDNSAFASHRERSQGARAKISALMPWGDHELSYEYIHRDIDNLSPGASVSVRQLAEPSTKSSIIHTFTRDTRDDPWMGTSGQLLKATHEYAGLPGSSKFAHFYKSTFQSQMSRALYSGSSIHYSISSLTTMLLPLSPGNQTPLPDRTYLGGPNSVRGFKIGGLGLRDGPDTLGGDFGWGAGLSVMGPIPGKPQREGWRLRWHSFINAGKVMGYDQDRSFSENVVKMYRNPSLSVGLGLMYRLDPIRVELNFSMPLIARKGERLARGLGVGVGLEFL